MENGLQSAAQAAGYCTAATCTPAELLRFAQQHGDELESALGKYAAALVSESATATGGGGATGGTAAQRAAERLDVNVEVIAQTR